MKTRTPKLSQLLVHIKDLCSSPFARPHNIFLWAFLHLLFDALIYSITCPPLILKRQKGVSSCLKDILEKCNLLTICSLQLKIDLGSCSVRNSRLCIAQRLDIPLHAFTCMCAKRQDASIPTQRLNAKSCAMKSRNLANHASNGFKRTPLTRQK